MLLPRSGGLTTDGEVSVARAGAGDVDTLRELFLAMHAHHRAVVALPLVPGEMVLYRFRD